MDWTVHLLPGTYSGLFAFWSSLGWDGLGMGLDGLGTVWLCAGLVLP